MGYLPDIYNNIRSILLLLNDMRGDEGKMALPCYNCDKVDKDTCARCRQVLKYEIVQEITGNAPRVYLDEKNRNKRGAVKKGNMSKYNHHYFKVRYEYEKNGLSMSEIADMLKISKTLVWNILHNKH